MSPSILLPKSSSREVSHLPPRGPRPRAHSTAPQAQLTEDEKPPSRALPPPPTFICVGSREKPHAMLIIAMGGRLEQRREANPFRSGAWRPMIRKKERKKANPSPPRALRAAPHTPRLGLRRARGALKKIPLLLWSRPGGWGGVAQLPFSPRSRRASCMSFGMIVTRFAWIAQRLVSSKRPTKYASAAS